MFDFDVYDEGSGKVIEHVEAKVGPNDHDLMMRLAKAGSEHAKYRRIRRETEFMTFVRGKR